MLKMSAEAQLDMDANGCSGAPTGIRANQFRQRKAWVADKRTPSEYS